MDIAALFGRVGPILAFLICITVIAELADLVGLFRALAYAAARAARGSVLVLWLLVVLVASLAASVLSLDSTAVLMTPVVLVLARRLKLSLGLFAFTAVWLANAASLILPVSNLTNLLALYRLRSVGLDGRGDVTALGFARLMWPAALTIWLITVVFLMVLYRRQLRGRFERPGWRPIGDRVLFTIAAVVCGGLGPAIALGVNVTVAAAAGAIILVTGYLVRQPTALRWRLLPWKLVLGVAALFVVVQVAHDHGLSGVLGRLAGSGDTGWDLLRFGAVAAGGANLINNLPAYLALEPLADSPWRVAALLIGVNAGPLITPWGSLATLLWAARCRSAGVRISWRRFVLRGLVLVPTLLAGGVAALVAVRALLPATP